MFSVVHCLILGVLCFASWLILCYVRVTTVGYVWEEEEFDINLDLQSTMNEENPEGISVETGSEFFINFVFVVTCIFLLIKVINLTNEYIAAKKAIQVPVDKQSKKNSMENASKIEEYFKEHEQLCTQIKNLKANNSELEDRVRELEKSNFLLQGESLNSCDHSSSVECIKCSEAAHQKIFISNQHFHVTSDPSPTSNLTFIWQNYLEMRKGCAKASLALVEPKSHGPEFELLSTDTKELASSRVTVIVSTEDLQKMQGLLPEN